MNEFIVWDNNYEKFSHKVCGILSDGSIAVFKEGHLSGIFYEDEYTIHYDIGKTDIEGKKIFAGSSIVEFEHMIFGEWVKRVGYFTYDDKFLSYEIVTKTGLILLYAMVLNESEIKNLKIIGTLQEDKHLLKAQQCH